jgi:hypothetical protein
MAISKYKHYCMVTVPITHLKDTWKVRHLNEEYKKYIVRDSGLLYSDLKIRFMYPDFFELQS